MVTLVDMDEAFSPGSPLRGQRRVRGLLQRLAPGRGREGTDACAGANRTGVTPIGDCTQRSRVSICGTLRTVTSVAGDEVPAVEAELHDGSGVVDIVWLGRRRIAGIEPGRTLRACGRLAERGGRKVMFNPSYELSSGDRG